MINNFYFKDDIEESYDSLRIKAFGGSSWFGLDGKPYPGLSFDLYSGFYLPKGEYEVSTNRNLKGSSQIEIRNSTDSVVSYISSEPKKVFWEEDSVILFSFYFYENTEEYFLGENYERQEDFGKDYSINIKAINVDPIDTKKIASKIKGDVNRDGKIDEKDLFVLRANLLGFNVENLDNFTMDLNKDGKINGEDLLILRKYFFGTEFFSDIIFVEN